MATELKDVKIKCISILVDDKKPANGIGVIVKDDGDSIAIEATIHKYDPEGFLIIRPMISKEIDSDGEYYSDQEIIDASYDAIKNIQKNGGTIFDTNHDYDVLKDVYFVETKIIKEDENNIWEMVLDIRENETLMEKAKLGLINGVSIAGTAKKVKVKKFEQLINKYKNKSIFNSLDVVEITKDFNTTMEDMTNNDIWKVMDVLWTAVMDEYWSRDIDDPSSFKKEFKKICTQAVKYVNSMTFEYIAKENTNNEENEEGESMEKKDVQAIVKEMIDPIIESLGLEEGQTLTDVITKAIGDNEPSMPVVKDSEGNEQSLVDAYAVLTEEIATQKSTIEELKKGITANVEIPETKEAAEIRKQRREAAKRPDTIGLL